MNFYCNHDTTTHALQVSHLYSTYTSGPSGSLTLLLCRKTKGSQAEAWPMYPWTHRPSRSPALGQDIILQCLNTVSSSASKSSIRRFVITEKAPTRAFSWLKAASTAFTFKTLVRHYAKWALTPRSLNVKLSPRRKDHKGQAVWLA